MTNMYAAGEPPPGVFVSYSSKDRLDALTVREILEERGCQVWLDVFDIVGTKALRPQLAEALRGAGVLCLLNCASSRSVALISTWTPADLPRTDLCCLSWYSQLTRQAPPRGTLATPRPRFHGDRLAPPRGSVGECGHDLGSEQLG
jgi:TIR domain